MGDMPDLPRSGRRPVAAIGLVAAAVLAAGLVTVRVRAADAATVVDAPRGATVAAPGGAPLPAVDGERLAPGSVVRTAAGGTVRLVTRGRVVALAGGTAVTVLDGARAALGGGRVLLDARRGPGLVLDTDAGLVTTREGSVLRVERGPVLRLAGYVGRASVRATGRAASRDLGPLTQAVVPFGGLPGAATPLTLTPGDPWEAAVLPRVVADEAVLRALATGLDAGRTGVAAVRRVSSSLPAGGPAALAGEPPSETALSYGLAAASSRLRGSGPERYAGVRAERDAGGSWGVLAARFSSRADAVSGVLDALLGAAPGGPVVAGQDPAATDEALGQALGTGPRATPSARPGRSGPSGGAPGRPSPAAPAAGRPAGSPGGAPGPGPASGPGPAPGPGSTPRPAPAQTRQPATVGGAVGGTVGTAGEMVGGPVGDTVGEAGDTVGTVVDTVVGLLPRPSSGRVP